MPALRAKRRFGPLYPRPEWKQYSLGHLAAEEIAGGSTNVTVQISIAPQTLDVGPASVVLVGR